MAASNAPLVLIATSLAALTTALAACIASVKKAMPGSELKTGTIVKGVIVRVKKNTRRKDGTYIRFDHNALVVLDGDGNPRGTRIFGAVGRELREKNFLKIVSLAQDVV